MLAVGVQSNDSPGVLRVGPTQAGMDCDTVAGVEGHVDYGSAGAAGHLPCPVRGSVIDNDHVCPRKLRPDSPNDTTDTSYFVVGGYDEVQPLEHEGFIDCKRTRLYIYVA